MTARSGRLVLGSVLLLVFMGLLTPCSSPEQDSPKGKAPPTSVIHRVPMPTDYFVENVGQVANPEVLFYHRAGGMDIGFGAGCILLKVMEPKETPPGPAWEDPDPRADRGLRENLRESGVGPLPPGTSGHVPQETPSRGVLLRLTFDGANHVAPVVKGEMPFRSSYFLGKGPEGWRTGVQSYRELAYRDLYDGIDLVCRPHGRGLKYEFQVEPGADPGQIALTFDGIENLDVVETEDVNLRTEICEIRDRAPVAFQGVAGEVACRFVSRGFHSYGFECEDWNVSETLVIDPLIYATYLGGTQLEGRHWLDSALDIALDGSGVAHVAGVTESIDFPVTVGVFDETYGGNQDAFVAKLDAAGGSLVYCTFLGGDFRDQALGIATDATSSAYVTGETMSSDFPTTPGAFEETHSRYSRDAFVAKLDPSGASLTYSTLLWNSGGANLAVDDLGNAYVAGWAGDEFPTTPGAYDTTYNGDADVFVAKLDPSGGGLVYSTYIGGPFDEFAHGIDLDPAGCAYVSGHTDGLFPTTPGVFDRTEHMSIDVFALKLSSSGGALVYSTYLGGDGWEIARDIAVDATGSAYVAGQTQSLDFPTTAGSYVTAMTGSAAFVTKLDPSGASLAYSTYLGGSRASHGNGIVVDSLGHAVVTGWTVSSDFPTTSEAYDGTLDGPSDAFVVKLDAPGTRAVYSTFLGGSDDDEGHAVVLDATGSVYVTGLTQSLDFPTSVGAFDTTYNGNWDCFLAKLDLGALGSGPCPHSQGYWKNHPAAWPVLTLDLGSETYDQAELIDLLKTPTRGDASLILAKQLIAAKLNVENGSDSGPVTSEIADADALLATYTGKLPYDVHASTLTGQSMVALGAVLDDYNNKVLTPGCRP